MQIVFKILLGLAIHSSAFAAGRVQNEDVKSQADIQSSAGSITGNLTSGSACVASPSSLSGLASGLYAYDSTLSTRIPSGTTITAIPGTCPAGQIQLSQNAAGSGTGDTITFGGTASQLINISKLWDNINLQLLSTTVTNFLPSMTGNSGKFLTTNGTTASWGTPGGGGGGSSVSRFTLSGAIIPFTAIDGAHYQQSTQSLTSVFLSCLNSGSSGSTTFQVNQYRSGSLQGSATASLSASSSAPAGGNPSLSGTLSLLAGDIVTVDVNSAAVSASDCSLEY